MVGGDPPDVQVLVPMPEGCVSVTKVDDPVAEMAVVGGLVQVDRSFEYQHQLLRTGAHVLMKVAEEVHLDPEDESRSPATSNVMTASDMP